MFSTLTLSLLAVTTIMSYLFATDADEKGKKIHELEEKLAKERRTSNLLLEANDMLVEEKVPQDVIRDYVNRRHDDIIVKRHLSAAAGNKKIGP